MGRNNQTGDQLSVKYSFLDGGRRVALTLQLDGRTVVDVMTPDGEVRETQQSEIDPRDSERLIFELFDIVPKLESRPDGEIWVRLLQNGEYWDYALSEYNVGGRGLDVGRIMRTIAGDILGGRDVRSDRREGGPRQASMTVFGYIKWTVYFILSLVAASIVGQIGMVAAGFIGPIMFSVSYTLAGFMMTGAYWTIGRKFGEHYRGAFPVWPVAITSCAPFAYLFYKFGGFMVLFPLIGMGWLIAFALAGEKAGY